MERPLSCTGCLLSRKLLAESVLLFWLVFRRDEGTSRCRNSVTACKNPKGLLRFCSGSESSWSRSSSWCHFMCCGTEMTGVRFPQPRGSRCPAEIASERSKASVYQKSSWSGLFESGDNWSWSAWVKRKKQRGGKFVVPRCCRAEQTRRWA